MLYETSDYVDLVPFPHKNQKNYDNMLLFSVTMVLITYYNSDSQLVE